VKKLYVPENEAELAVIKSLLDGERIKYFVQNDHFGYPLYNEKTIMVAEDQYDWAVAILNSFVTRDKASKVQEARHSLLGRIRMIFETLLLGWIMPGQRWRKKGR
jgi:hypothetical protein